MREYDGKTYAEGDPHTMDQLAKIVRIWRSPQGCAWDREQAHGKGKKSKLRDAEVGVFLRRYANCFCKCLEEVAVIAEAAFFKRLVDTGTVV